MPEQETEGQIIGGPGLQPLLHPQARRARAAAPGQPVLAEEARVLYELAHARTAAPPRRSASSSVSMPATSAASSRNCGEDGLIAAQAVAVGPPAIPARPDREGARRPLPKLDAQSRRRRRRDAGRDCRRRRWQPAGRCDGRHRTAARRQQRETPPAILREPRPGDMGWVVSEPWRALRAGIWLGHLSSRRWSPRSRRNSSTSFDASREHCWIADIDGEPVGSIFLVTAQRRSRQAAPAAGRPAGARTWRSAARWPTNASVSRAHAAIARSRCGPRAFWSPRARFIRMPDSCSWPPSRTAVSAKA